MTVNVNKFTDLSYTKRFVGVMGTRLARNPMATNIFAGGAGLFASSQALKSYDSLRNQQYGSAALHAGLAGGSARLAYMAAFEKSAFSTAIKSAASRLI